MSLNGLCPTTAWCNESPTHSPPHLRPSLPLPRITHAELSNCTVLSHMINTQDHWRSHLWAASFGAIVSVVAFSEKLSFFRNVLRMSVVMRSDPTQRLITILRSRTQTLLSALLYYFLSLLRLMHLGRLSLAFGQSVEVMGCQAC